MYLGEILLFQEHDSLVNFQVMGQVKVLWGLHLFCTPVHKTQVDYLRSQYICKYQFYIILLHHWWKTIWRKIHTILTISYRHIYVIVFKYKVVYRTVKIHFMSYHYWTARHQLMCTNQSYPTENCTSMAGEIILAAVFMQFSASYFL